jgi:hypothetical protein
MDCDFLRILPELRDMFDAAVEGYDVVLGSRFSRESVLINYPLMKILCNRSFHLLLMLIFRRRLLDVTNNLKLLSREVVDNLEIEAPWFAANAETGAHGLQVQAGANLLGQSYARDGPVELFAAQERLGLYQGSGHACLADSVWHPAAGPAPQRLAGNLAASSRATNSTRKTNAETSTPLT